MSSVTNGRNSLGITSYNNIPYSNADTDSDGIISIGEALIWEDERESYPAEDPTISDDGDLRFSTSLKYPNILRHDINGTTLIRGIVAITQDICLSNAEVTIAPGAKVYLKNRSQILVEEGASLIISDNVKIYGNDYSIPPDETNPDGVVGNRVIVNGNISIGENVTFESEYGNPWDGLYINNNADITLAGISFTKCDLVKTGGILRIQDSVFSNSQVTCESASLYMDGCNVDRGVYCIIFKNKDAYASAIIDIADEEVISFVTRLGNQEKPDIKTIDVLAGDTTQLQGIIID